MGSMTLIKDEHSTYAQSIVHFTLTLQ